MIGGDFHAMGTTIEVWSEDRTGIDRTREWFAEVESIASRFDASSELSALNARTTGGATPVGPILARILAAALMARELTGGLVDPAVGADVLRWGYDRTFEELVEAPEPPVGSPIGDWSIDGSTLRRDPGTILDLGGVAKGWTADMAVEAGFATVVSAGGDTRSAHPGTEARILGPDDHVVATVLVGCGALATSSTTRRRWSAGTRRAHHIIDPRTGAPAVGPVVSATALADSAVLAEAAAKGILLHGVDGLAWASAQPWIDGALVVWEDGSVFTTTGVELAA